MRLIGRESDLKAIRSTVDESCAGTVAVLLDGPAGIGKTELWRAGLGEAEARDFQVDENDEEATVTYFGFRT